MEDFERVWRDYHAKLGTFIKNRIPDEMGADDVLQDIFLKVHTRLASLKDQTKLQSWLYQIARNAVIDYYRRQTPSEALPETVVQPTVDPSEKALMELSECLLPMIEQLPPHYRETIILSEIEGKALKEVAHSQGISLSGAKSRVQRGRTMLKDMLAGCCRLEFDHGGRLSGYESRRESRHLGDVCVRC